MIKGYPTVDKQTRETIGMHHFLKGLPDEQTIIAVGMDNTKTVDAVCTAYETYISLKNDIGCLSYARVAQTQQEKTDSEKATATQWITE